MATNPQIRYDILANAQGAQDVEKLATELEKLDASVDSATAERAQRLAAELRELGAQAAAVQQFRQLKQAVEEARTELDAAQAAAQAMGREIAATESPTRAQAGQMQKLADAVRTTKLDLQDQTRALDGARGTLNQLGLSTDGLAAAEARLRTTLSGTRTEANDLVGSYQAIEKAQAEAAQATRTAAEAHEQELRTAQAAAAEQAHAAQQAAEAAAQRERQAQQQRSDLGALEDAARRMAGEFGRAGVQAGELGKALPDSARVQPLIAQLERLGDSIDPAVAARARELSGDLQRLGQQRAAIENFKSLSTATDTARRRMQEADAAVDAFHAELGDGAPTEREAARLSTLTERARAARVAYLEAANAQGQAGASLRAAGVDTDRLVAAQSRVPPQLTATAAAARQVASAQSDLGRKAQQSGDQQWNAARRMADGMQSISQQLQTLQQFSVGAILGSQFGQLARDVTQTADAYNNLSARVRLVTGDGAAFQQAMEGVFAIAQRTDSALESTATLFTRIAQAGKEMGLSQQQALALTESINEAVQISGGSAESADAAITQLIQGLQSGVLRGEEFNSVMEQAPRLAQALAAGLGVTIGQLRQLSQQGQLTSTTVIGALQQQSATLKAEFEQLPATVGRAITNLQTEWTRFVGQLDSSSGSTALVAEGINTLAGHLDGIARVAAAAGTVLTAQLAVKGAAALRTFAVEATAAAGSANLLAASISKIPAVINITVAAVGFEVGYEIGRMLYDNSELARKLGVGITAFLQNLASDLQLLVEGAKAIFTDDTVEAAFGRWRDRGKEMDRVFSEMWDDAAQAPKKVGQAAEASTQATQDLGKAATASGAQIAQAGAAGAAGVAHVGKEAETAQAAIQALAAAAGVKLPTVGATAAQQAAAMGELAGKSRQVADALGKNLPEAIAKLSGAELAKFRADMIGALQGAGDQARLLQTALGEIGRRAAEALGVDVVSASQTISQEFETASDNLAVLIRSLGALEKAGVDTSAVVSQALSKMIDGARNQAELAAVRDRILALGKAGEVAKPQVDALLDGARQKALDLKAAIDQATPGINSVAEAMKQLGITSDASLRNTAAQSKKSYDALAASGTASARELAEGFQRAAQDAIAANNGVAPEWVKSQAIVRKFQIEVDAAGKATVKAMGTAGGSVDGLKQHFEGLIETVNQYGERLNQLAGSIDGLNGQAGVRNADQGTASKLYGSGASSSSSRTESGQYLPPDNSGDWVFDEQKWIAAGRPTLVNNGQFAYWTRTKISGGGGAGSLSPTPFTGGTGGGAGSLSPATPSSAGSVTVKLDFGGGKSTAVNVAGQADADALVRALQDAARMSGASL